jgi:hypothetical protein
MQYGVLDGILEQKKDIKEKWTIWITDCYSEVNKYVSIGSLIIWKHHTNTGNWMWGTQELSELSLQQFCKPNTVQKSLFWNSRFDNIYKREVYLFDFWLCKILNIYVTYFYF